MPTWIIWDSQAPIIGHVVVVTDGVVQGVFPESEVTVLETDAVVDLSGITLLPGLINDHVHLYCRETTRLYPMDRSSIRRDPGVAGRI